MKKNKFLQTLDSTEEYLYSSMKIVKSIRELYEKNDRAEAFRQTFMLQPIVENLTLLARALPTYTSHPNSIQIVERVTKESIPVDIGYTAEGWFCVRLPMLLPKKNEGSAEYIRQFLYFAMKRFFTGKEPRKYDGAVLIYRHVYTEECPERQKRDHDNIEVNMVSDIIAMYSLCDDGPEICSHFYCSALGDKERTEVYVVPQNEFSKWLLREKEMSKGGVELYEND